MAEAVTYEVLERLTPRQRAVLHRVAKTKMRPWFANPNHMIRLRVLVEMDKVEDEE